MVTKKTAPKKAAPKKRVVKKKVAKKKAGKKKTTPRRNAVSATKLTAKQDMFVKEYLIDLNATQAAIRAGYSEKTAKDIGCENLTKPNISKAIFIALEKRTEKVETSAEWVLERLHNQAVADLADIYHENGSLKPIHEWPKVWRQGLIVGVETKQEYTYVDGQKKPDGVVVKVKISERIKRDELIGKHHAMFTDNVNLGGSLELQSMTPEQLATRREELLKKSGNKASVSH